MGVLGLFYVSLFMVPLDSGSDAWFKSYGALWLLILTFRVFLQALILGLRKFLVRRTHRRSRPILCQLSSSTTGFWV